MEAASIAPEAWTPEAEQRLKHPRHRGRYWPDDAGQKRHALVSAGNGEGRIYWLVDAASRRVEGAKFLAYGDKGSLPVLDVWSELATGRSVEQALEIAPLEIAGVLGVTEASWSPDMSFLRDLKARVFEAARQLEVPELPAIRPYVRKPRTEMDERDLAWLPLGAPQKIRKVQHEMARCLRARTGHGERDAEVYNVRRDLEVEVLFAADVKPEERPLLLQFMQDAGRGALHPGLEFREVQR